MSTTNPVATPRHRRGVFAVLLAVVFAVSGALNFTNLGQSSLFSDEAIYAVAAHNAVAHGQWYPLIYQDRIYSWKPPLAVWPEAVSFAIFGETALADRMPSATIAVLVTGLLFVCAAAVLGHWYGFFAALLFATSPLWLGWHGPRQGVADPLLCLSLLLALMSYQRYRESGTRVWLLAACIATAVSGLCKGLAGPVFLFVAAAGNELLGVFMHWRSGVEVDRAAWRGALRMPAILFGAGSGLYACWLVDNAIRDPEFLGQLYRDTVSRAVRGVDPGHVHGAAFYLNEFLQAGGYVGLVLVAIGLFVALRSAQNERLRLVALWFIAVTALLHCSVSKLKWYLDPALPAAAILAAAAVQAIFARVQARRMIAWTAAVVPALIAGHQVQAAWNSVRHAQPMAIDMHRLSEAVKQIPAARFYSENFDRAPTRDFSGWNMYFREWNEYYLDQIESRTQPIPQHLEPGGCDIVLTDRAQQRLQQSGFEDAVVVPLRKFNEREASLSVLDLCQGRIAAQLRGS